MLPIRVSRSSCKNKSTLRACYWLLERLSSTGEKQLTIIWKDGRVGGITPPYLIDLSSAHWSVTVWSGDETSPGSPSLGNVTTTRAALAWPAS